MLNTDVRFKYNIFDEEYEENNFFKLSKNTLDLIDKLKWWIISI